MDLSITAWSAPLGGETRVFDLTIGGCASLERVASAGIGEVFARLATNAWSYAMVREAIRQGLLGGGASDAETIDVVTRFVDGRPIGGSVQLAADIVAAFIQGRDVVLAAKKAQAEEQQALAALAAAEAPSQPSRETSPNTISSAPPSA